MFQAVFGAVDLVLVEPFGTREAPGRDVVGVGANLLNPTALDVDFETAEGLADAAESAFRLHPAPF